MTGLDRLDRGLDPLDRGLDRSVMTKVPKDRRSRKEKKNALNILIQHEISTLGYKEHYAMVMIQVTANVNEILTTKIPRTFLGQLESICDGVQEPIALTFCPRTHDWSSFIRSGRFRCRWERSRVARRA